MMRFVSLSRQIYRQNFEEDLTITGLGYECCIICAALAATVLRGDAIELTAVGAARSAT